MAHYREQRRLVWMALLVSLLLHILVFSLRSVGRGDLGIAASAGHSERGFAYRLLLPAPVQKGLASTAVIAPSFTASTVRSIERPVPQIHGDAAGILTPPSPIHLLEGSSTESHAELAPEVLKPSATVAQPTPAVPLVPKSQNSFAANSKELSDDDLDQVSPSGYTGSGFALFRHMLRQSLEAQLNGQSLQMPDHTNLDCRFKLLMSRKDIQLRGVKCVSDAQFERLQTLLQTDKLPSSLDFGLGPAVVTVRATGNGQIRMD